MENQNLPPQAQETHSQTPSPDNNSSGSKIILIILGVAAVVIIAIGAYLLGAKQSQPSFQMQEECESKTGKKCSFNMCQESEGSPMPIGWCKSGFYPSEDLFPINTQPSPTSIDETANWMTYTSPNKVYSFKYPSNTSWKLNESDGPLGTIVSVLCNNCDSQNVYRFEVAPTRVKSLDEYINNHKGTSYYLISKILDGVNSVRANYNGGPKAGGVDIKEFFVYNKQGYEITMWYDVFDISRFPIPNPDILSTFQFSQ